MKISTSNLALFVIALLCFFGLYEIYLRPGWVDSSMYIGYAINPNIYNVYPFVGHNYQGSRLGYVLPLQFLLTIFGGINGRLIYVFILYLAYFFSVLTLTRFFIKNKVERVLLSVLFIFNPGFISSIFYGGADGPAAVQLLVATSFLIYAIQGVTLFKRCLLSFFSGFFLILSISSHIFAVIPAFLIIPTLLYVLKQARLAVPIIIGGFIATFICNSFGHYLGLEQFYFLYSLPWAKASITGFGTIFVDSFAHWIRNAIFWCPIILSIPLFFLINRNLSFREDKQFSLMMASLLNLTGPIIIYTLYDAFTGGNTIATPAYFNIIYPSFVVGLTLMISLNIETIGNMTVLKSKTYRYQTWVALTTLVFVSLISNFTAEHVRSVFTYNSIKTSDFYRSTVSFMERFKSSGLDTRKIQFIFKSAGPEGEHDPRVYKDSFKGSRRYFDYLDSLTGLFLWDRSIALRLDPNVDLEMINFKPQKKIPIVFLGRNKTEVQRLVASSSDFLDGFTAGPYQCFDDVNYPWCFTEFRNPKDFTIFKILSWWPQSTGLGGIGLNQLPDKTLAVWIHTSGDEELGSVKVLFDGQPAISTSVRPGLITASIATDSLNTSGKKEISIKQVFTGKIFPVGVFYIDEKKRHLDFINRIEAESITPGQLRKFVGATFGGLFSLRGLDIKCEPDGLNIKLAWESKVSQKLNLTNAVHLINDTGEIQGQADYKQPITKSNVEQGDIWLDSVFISSNTLNNDIKKIGIVLYGDSGVQPLVEKDHTDWDGNRLIIPFDKYCSGD